MAWYAAFEVARVNILKANGFKARGLSMSLSLCILSISISVFVSVFVSIPVSVPLSPFVSVVV